MTQILQGHVWFLFLVAACEASAQTRIDYSRFSHAGSITQSMPAPVVTVVIVRRIEVLRSRFLRE